MAPRLPSAEDLGLPGSLESRRGIASFDTSALAKGADAIGRGAQALGSGVIAFADKQKREGDQFEKAEADAAFIKDHTALLTEQARNPDPDAYRRESQAILQKAAERLGDQRERKLWELGKASQLAHGSSQVDGAAFRVAADSFGAGSQRAEDDAQEVLKNSTDPAAHHQIMEAGAARYQEAVRRGYITEQQAQAATKVFAARSMHTVLGQQPIDEQVAALQGPATDRNTAINRIEQVESNGNAAAKNPLSTATGAGQFTEGTWLATLKAHRPDLLEGRSREQVLALRNDRTLSREAIGYLYDDNLAALGAQGLPANPTTGYLSHFLGSGGAAAVLKAAPGTPVSDVLGDDQIAANRSILAGKTVDTVKAWAARKMGESPLSSGLQSLPADTREKRFRPGTSSSPMALSSRAITLPSDFVTAIGSGMPSWFWAARRARTTAWALSGAIRLLSPSPMYCAAARASLTACRASTAKAGSARRACIRASARFRAFV